MVSFLCISTLPLHMPCKLVRHDAGEKHDFCHVDRFPGVLVRASSINRYLLINRVHWAAVPEVIC